MRGNLKLSSSAKTKPTCNSISEEVLPSWADHEDDISFLVQRMASNGVLKGKGYLTSTITINAGEDVAQKILIYFQECRRMGVIVSATGSICRPRLNHQGSIVSYEGSCVILKMSGHYSFKSNGEVKQSGKLSIIFANSDGDMFGGFVAGSLTAAASTQVVVGSFILDDNQE